MNNKKLVIGITFLIMLSVTKIEAIQAVVDYQEVIDVVIAYFG